MLCLSKRSELFFSVLLFSGLLVLLLVEPCVAPVTVPAKPKPGPEIVSVVVHNNPVWRPPITQTNPYTGEVLSTQRGMSLPNGTVEITIKNRPFTPYTDKDGNTINTYYCILYNRLDDRFSGWMGERVKIVGDREVFFPYALYQSDSDYTVITFKYGSSGASPDNYDSFGKDTHGFFWDVSFRIQTVEEGYFDFFDSYEVYEGVGSEWTEFAVAMPSHDSYREENPSGTFKPNFKPTSIVPETSNPNNLPTSEPARPPELWTTYVLAMAIVVVCFVPLVVVVCRYRQKKNRRYIQTISSRS